MEKELEKLNEKISKINETVSTISILLEEILFFIKISFNKESGKLK